jgi:hypothetical protein
MTGRITPWIRSPPVRREVTLAAHSHGLIPFDSPRFYLVGGIGPLLAAFIVMRIVRDVRLGSPLGARQHGATFTPGSPR